MSEKLSEQLQDWIALANKQRGNGVAMFVTTLIGMKRIAESMESELADWKETSRKVMAEECAPDEKHCTCVPFLRREIDSQRKELARLRPLAELLSAEDAREAAELILKERSLSPYHEGIAYDLRSIAEALEAGGECE